MKNCINDIRSFVIDKGEEFTRMMHSCVEVPPPPPDSDTTRAPLPCGQAVFGREAVYGAGGGAATQNKYAVVHHRIFNISVNV